MPRVRVRVETIETSGLYQGGELEENPHVQFNVNCKVQVCICYGLNMFLSIQDRRLHLLATSIRGALKSSFNNGQSKAIVYDIVSLVRQHTLCDMHNLRLNVCVRIRIAIVQACM